MTPGFSEINFFDLERSGVSVKKVFDKNTLN